jgi:NhaP-type Na+/H+ or K+/H+ antiporter
VLVSLMGAGLKLDTPLGLRRWATTWRLLGITMPLSIAGIALLSWLLLDLSWPAALLLGAALAPTDPVLAADVQVGPPGQGEEEDHVRFALTSEAGLNDSLAFPFVNLALALVATQSSWSVHWTLEWLAVDVVWKIAAGIAGGWLVGRLAAYLLFRMPEHVKLARAGDGFVAIGVTLLAYGLTELAHGYGFLAVFCAAVTIRNGERGHEIHHRLHDFADEVERLATAALLVMFGASLVSGLLAPLTASMVLVAVLAIVAVRPLAGLAGLAGKRVPTGERLAIAFFGIRGMGTVYYLAYGLHEGRFTHAEAEILWAVAALAIALSILVHGTTATPVMSRFGPSSPKTGGNDGARSVDDDTPAAGAGRAAERPASAG